MSRAIEPLDALKLIFSTAPLIAALFWNIELEEEKRTFVCVEKPVLIKLKSPPPEVAAVNPLKSDGIGNGNGYEKW